MINMKKNPAYNTRTYLDIRAEGYATEVTVRYINGNETTQSGEFAHTVLQF